MTIRSKHFALSLAAGSLLLPVAFAQTPSATLVTGKRITLPPLGTSVNVGSLPLHLLSSPDGAFALVSDMGFRQRLTAIRTSDGTETGRVEFSNAAPNPGRNGLYYGLAFGAAGTLYAAQGGNHSIAVLGLGANGALTLSGSIRAAQTTDFPAGLATDTRGFLYVANNDPETFNVPGSLSVLDTATRTEVGRVHFAQSFGGTPNFPLAVAALANGSKVYVSSQRDNAVYVVNAANPQAPTLAGVIPTGAHPISLLLSKNQMRLFVANAHSDTVSIVDTASDTVLRTILLRPDGARGLAGVTPTGLALSPDEKTLYVSLGDMNAVAVVDTDRYRLTGYVPAGWYPTGVVVAPNNGRLLVANAKGTQTRYPNPGYKEYTPQLDESQYGLNLIEGNVQTIGLPIAPATQAGYTQQVIANNRITLATDRPAANPLAGLGRGAGKIRHVIYIVKENRTYDQVLGDLPRGNGDPSLTLFGRDVTPNQHALAERFALLDNFYDCGEASGDGWPWSTQGIANEYVIKNLPYNYSGRGRNYDFEGTNNNYLTGGHPAKDPDGNTLSQAFPNGAPAIPDVSEAPAGYLWDLVHRAGLSYRNFGFFYSFGQARTNAPIIPDNYPASSGIQPAGHDLAGRSDWDFRRYDNDYADSDAPRLYDSPPALAAYGKYNMPSRFAEWNREFQQMIAQNRVPAFMTVRFHRDHTQGLQAGKFSPRSEVADNDYAVGQLVDAVSHSPVWNNTAIFVIEDDSQAGPDHVDSHRSICFVVSPYVKRSTLDSTFYNTDTVLKTMELLLGLPALSQYDAVADPFGFFDGAPANSEPYTAILPARAIITEKNPAQVAALAKNDPRRPLMEASARMNFDLPDSANPRLLNEIIWKSVKGAHSPMPEPIHSGVTLAGSHDRDGDDADDAVAPAKATVKRAAPKPVKAGAPAARTFKR